MFVVRTCPSCGKRNRFRRKTLESGGANCGTCGLLLEAGEVEPSVLARLFGAVKQNKSVAVLVVIAVAVGAYIVSMPKPKPLDDGPIAATETVEPVESVEPPVEAWKPPRFESQPVWTESTTIRPITTPVNQPIAVAGTPTSFVSVGGSVYEVATGRLLTRHRVPVGALTAVSRNGKYFAQLFPLNGKQVVALYSNLPDAGKPIRIADFPAKARIGLFRFAADKLLIQQRRIGGSLVFVYQSDGTLETTFEVSSFSPRGCGFNSDETVMAVAGPFAIELLELATGKSFGRLEQVETGFPPSNCNALAFSPDDKTVAGLLHQDRFVIWDSTTGDVLLERRLSKVVTNATSDVGSIQWLPNGRGWLLNERFILAADPVLEIWQAPESSQHVFVVDSSHLLMDAQAGNRQVLMQYTLPWAAIDESLTTLGQPVLEKGENICLSLDLSRVDNRLADQIELSVRNRCEELGFIERNKARVHLILRVSESDGTSRDINQQELVDENGTPIQMVEITCKFQLRDMLSNKVLWERSVKTDGGVELLEKSSRKNGRKRAINALLTRIRLLNIPTEIIDDPKYRFPIKASLPD